MMRTEIDFTVRRVGGKRPGSGRKKHRDTKAIFNYWLRYKEKRFSVIANLFNCSIPTVSRIITKGLQNRL